MRTGRRQPRGSESRLVGGLFVAACGVIVVLTFALGVLVGRQWARSTEPGRDYADRGPAERLPAETPGSGPGGRVASRPGHDGGPAASGTGTKPPFPEARPASAATVAPRSEGTGARARHLPSAEPPPDTTAQIREKLTFYQALPAPLTAGPGPTPGPSAPPVAPREGSGSHDNGAERFTVQVAAFRTREQADALREKLGRDAYVAEVGAAPATRYRVRVGTFSDRAQADATAARLRGDHALITFVTTK